MPFAVALDAEILCRTMAIQEEVEVCKKIIHDPSGEEAHDWTLESEEWEVSVSNNPFSTC
jgi:hypothetical protein